MVNHGIQMRSFACRSAATGWFRIHSESGAGVKRAVLETLAPQKIEDNHVTVREAFGEVGDGPPPVTVDPGPGRDPVPAEGRGSSTVQRRTRERPANFPLTLESYSFEHGTLLTSKINLNVKN